ncbi:MAG: YcxB family protein [Bacillota bacterium]|nr:YcxB family protein [Bacillota bacterium]
MRSSSRITVDTAITEQNLSEYYVFSEIFMNRNMIPLVLVALCMSPVILVIGFQDQAIGAIVCGFVCLLIVAAYVLNYFRCKRKFLERNKHTIGNRSHYIIDRLSGITVEELSKHNIETFSWKQIDSSGENKNIMVIMFKNKYAIYIPKSDIDPEDALTLKRILYTRFKHKHRDQTQ